MKIIYSLKPNSKDIDFLTDRLDEDACSVVQMPPSQSFGFFINCPKMEMIAGCNGIISYGALFVRQLWVVKELRMQKYGTRLIHEVEDLAINKKCNMIIIRTMSWQAIGFYRKLGYFVEFEQPGFKKDSIMYHLRKNITLS